MLRSVEMRLVPCVSDLDYHQNFSRSCNIFLIPHCVRMVTTKSLMKCLKRKLLKSTGPLCRGSPVSSFRSIQVFNKSRTALPCSCDEWEMWRLVYATRKLKAPDICKLWQTLEDLAFSSGAKVQDVGLPTELEGAVYMKRIYCDEPIEGLYYSANFDDICIYCAGDVPPWSNMKEFYPQCEDCSDKPCIANIKKPWKLCVCFCLLIHIVSVVFCFLEMSLFYTPCDSVATLLSCTFSVLHSRCLCSYTVFSLVPRLSNNVGAEKRAWWLMCCACA